MRWMHLCHSKIIPQGHHVYSFRSASHTCISVYRRQKKILDRNNATERGFIDLPGATPVDIADIEAMHKAYDSLVQLLCCNLVAPIPFQNDSPTSDAVPVTNPAPASYPDLEAPKPVVPGKQKEDVRVDKALEAIIESMETTPTEKDIMKLVFYWTTLNECNGFTRADVIGLN